MSGTACFPENVSKYPEAVSRASPVLSSSELTTSSAFLADLDQRKPLALHAPHPLTLDSGHSALMRWAMSIHTEEDLMQETEHSSRASLPEALQTLVQLVHLKTHVFCGLSSTQLEVYFGWFNIPMSRILSDGMNIHSTTGEIR